MAARNERTDERPGLVVVLWERSRSSMESRTRFGFRSSDFDEHDP